MISIFDPSSWDFSEVFGFLSRSAANSSPSAQQLATSNNTRKTKKHKEGAKSATSKRVKTKREAAKRTKVNTRAQTQRDAVITSKRQPKTTNASRTVWIGELGDIREHKDSQVIGWATENGKMLGDLLNFVPDAEQPDPRYV